MMIDLPAIRRMADMIATTDDRDDELGFLDTLEGETEAMEIADYLIRLALQSDALEKAAKAEEEALSMRRKRFADRAKAARRAQLELLDAIGVKKLERPRATISRRSGSIGVSITDEAEIPSQLMTVKEVRSPDKAAIRAQIEAGETIPGAELVRGPDSITMRVL